MSELVLSLIDEKLQELTDKAAVIERERAELESERSKIVSLKKKIEAPAKVSRPKAGGRKSSGPTIKSKILDQMRIADGPVTIGALAGILSAKSTTINGTLHGLKKAGSVMLTKTGWILASSPFNPNSGEQAHP